ncbi:MAG: beta-ketoacyl synthase chain length factor [Xanthomonadales bacterium]|nr:beta-ketoacyl synthase chain length factor [Xanthomonadales bacterium]
MSMSALDIRIEGIGFWAPGWPNWQAARAGLRGDLQADPAVIKPSPDVLVAAERRRAPLAVLLACDVAAQACADSGRNADTLASVFASTHGDLVITDYMCSTLAIAPRELSPIKFHNSVHNAPAGYWTIAAHCHAASTSISSWHSTFAVALFEAAVQANADQLPVLLAAYDADSPSPLNEVSPASSIYGVAMVVAPARDHEASLRLRFNAPVRPSASMHLPRAFADMAGSNPMAAQSLPLLAALASARPHILQLNAGLQSTLGIEVCT